MNAKSLRVAAAQMKFAPTVEGNLAGIERLVRRAAGRKADAILFPECATTGYTCDFSHVRRAEALRALQRVSRIAAANKINVLIGAPVFRGEKLFNALVVFDRCGEIVHCYAKCHLTEIDARFFTPGNAVALFQIDGVCATSVICHERRYPELVRVAVMSGAQILFHPNAGLDRAAVSRAKRGGRDGISTRAFENAIYYVFANSVGPQGGGLWSAGDSKIVAPDGRVLALAGNTNEELIVADLDLSRATRGYARRGMARPKFLAGAWKRIVRAAKAQARREGRSYELP